MDDEALDQKPTMPPSRGCCDRNPAQLKNAKEESGT
jgi:hypothetical protein